MCDRCADLEDRIAWLESELGLQRENSGFDKLRSYLRAQTTADRRGTPCVSRLILALYRAGGRVMNMDQIMEAVPPLSGSVLEDLRDTAIIKVWVCYARRSLGRDAIENAWGRGYRLTEAGRLMVAGILGEAPAAQAAA